MISFIVVGKKPILQLTCSILNVYSGALTSFLGVAATAVTAQNTTAALRAITTFRLSMISPPSRFFNLVDPPYKYFGLFNVLYFIN
jgi:hypothetical protein